MFTFEGFEREPLLGWHEDYVFVQPEIDAMLRAGLARFDHVDVRLGIEAPPLAELTGLAGTSSRATVRAARSASSWASAASTSATTNGGWSST